MLILAFRTFEIGDQIILTAAEGSVEQIDLRATHIRTPEGRLVIVPNSDVFTSSVTNNTASPLRRATIPVYVAYKEDLARALAVARGAAKATPGVASQLPADAIIREFGPEAVVLQVTFWTDSVRGDFGSTVAAARLAIVEALKNADIMLPDPGVRQLAIKDAETWQDALSPSTEPRDAHAPTKGPASAGPM
jgi:small-conductance mechanosensitive channel